MIPPLGLQALPPMATSTLMVFLMLPPSMVFGMVLKPHPYHSSGKGPLLSHGSLTSNGFPEGKTRPCDRRRNQDSARASDRMHSVEHEIIVPHTSPTQLNRTAPSNSLDHGPLPHSRNDRTPPRPINLYSHPKRSLICRNLSLGTMNVRGFNTIVSFLKEQLLHLDILAIQEHWLLAQNCPKLNSVSNEHLVLHKPAERINGSLNLRTQRGKGGLAIFIRKSLVMDCWEIKCPSPRLLAAHVKVKESTETFTFVSCYLPCGVSNADQIEYHSCLSHLSYLLESTKSTSAIIMGDINVDIIHPNTKKTLAILQDFLNRENLCCLTSSHFSPDTYTFQSDDGRHKSCIDTIIAPSRDEHLFSNISTVENDPTNTSDHLLIIASRSYEACYSDRRILHSQIPSSIQRLKVKWQDVDQATIEEMYTVPMEKISLNLFRSLSNIDHIPLSEAENLLSSFSDFMVSYSVNLPHTLPNGKKKGKAEWNGEVSQAYKLAKESRKTWLLTETTNKDQANEDCIIAKKSFRKCLRQSRAHLRNNLFSEIESASASNSKLFYRLVKINRGSDSLHCEVDHLSYGDHDYKGDEMLLGWQLYFTALSSDGSNTSHISSAQGQSPAVFLPHEDSSAPELRHGIQLTSKDLDEAIKHLKLGKAAGEDNVSPEHLKHLGDTARRLLLALFNTFLHHAHCPKIFKQGLIPPLHKGKGKDPHDPRNYRGITLTSVLCKLLELCLKPQLIRQLYISDTPDQLQFGFRKGFSCALTSISLELIIELNTAHKFPTYLALLDAEKAFDTVWHRGLFEKLKSSHLDPSIQDMLESMYHGIESKVFWKGAASNPIPITQGVRQGGVMSPLLYTAFVDGLIKELREKNLGSSIDGRFSGVVVLADDVALVANSPDELQLMLDATFNYAGLWHYKINPTKSAVIVFNNTKHPTRSSWTVNGSIVDVKTSHPHLGISKSGSRSDLTDSIIGTGLRAFYSLSGSGAYTGGLTPMLVTHLWRTFCIPRMLHGASITKLTKSMLQKLDKAQTHLFKRVLGVPITAADEIVHLLTNLLPLSIQIDLDRLLLFGQLSNLDHNRYEYRTFLAALGAWTPTIQIIQDTLRKYDLPDLHTNISKPLPYSTFKKLVKDPDRTRK
ncbi:uncharacterized protein LOC129267838 [Lytechinus pictus]|uniref:uncharacterized protein LOC129267838 n=1 Tax=Lytechinus pictus TaxID=7653 RepID=UPI0030B9B18E